MQERLAAEDAEVAVAVRLGVADDAVQLVERQLLRRRGDVHPAALAAQLTARDDRDEQERREVLAAPPPPLVQLDRADALDAEVVDELRHDLRVWSRSARAWSGRTACSGLRRPGRAAGWPLRARSRAASALARISSGDGSAASTSGGMSRSRLQRDQAVLALLERALVVALLREARLRLRAAVAQHRVDVAAEQRRDVDLHRLAPDVVGRRPRRR